LVYEKHKRPGPVRILNHSLTQPEEIQIKETKDRLDFSFFEAVKAKSKLTKTNGIVWRAVEELAHLSRGTIKTPTKSRAVHTTHYDSGFWKIGSQPLGKGESVATSRDVLVRRVSRACATSFGLLRGTSRARVTDCVLILRPKADVTSHRLLFCLRVYFGWKWAAAVLESGAGATFIAQNELAKTLIPSNLALNFPEEFAGYVAAVRKQDFGKMQQLEERVRTKLSP
jgi:hypothetical protein